MVPSDDDLEPSAPSEAEESAPLVLVPVAAEDVARQQRRTKLAIGAAVLAVLLGVGYVYKRATDPIHARESFEQGMRLFALGRYPQAILAFDRVTSLAPEMADAYLMRGRAYAADNKIDRAIADFAKSLQLRPNDTQALLARGREWLDVKDFQSAVADANRALEIDSRFAPAYNLRGVAVRSLGDPRRALDDLTRAIQLSPDSDNYFQRGATYQMLGDHERALADLNKMIAIQPGSAPAYFARAESRLALGDVQGAEQDRLQGRYLDGR